MVGSLQLAPGDYTIEGRFAVDALSDLPLEITLAIDGGPATSVGSSLLTHDQTNLPPTINSMPTVGTSLGGNDIEIRGLGYFPDDSVVVHWGDTDFGPANFDELGPERIRFDSPPGQGQIQVTVETPNGVSNAVTFTYDDAGPVPIDFDIVNEVVLPTRSTAGAWGPDGKFYVAQLDGHITAIEFDQDWQAVSVQTFTGVSGLPNPEIMGLAFDPYDSTTPIRIWVDHTKLFADGGAAIPPGTFSSYPGQVSVLEGPNFDTAIPVITKLPTSNHDHANNGMVFDNNGDLLISVGSQTNAGIPHPNSGDLPESPLSAAVLRAHVSKPTFNGALSYVETLGDSVNENQVFGELVDVASGVDVEVFAPGVRNAFGLGLHTNGYLYTLDNGPNFGFGAQSTGPDTLDADPYGPDQFLLLEEGNYYGSPNRNRGRKDPRQNYFQQPEAAPAIPGEYTAPLSTVASSQNGAMEYRSNTFQGQLRGAIVTQKWANTPRILHLSEDGRSVTSEQQIFPWTGGLQTIPGPGGALLSIDYFNRRLKILEPQDLSATGLTLHDVFPWRAPAEGFSPFVLGGVGFGTDASKVSVTFGGNQAIITDVEDKRIRGLIPAELNPSTGLVDVVVQVGTASSTLEDGFRYLLGRGLEPGQWDTVGATPEALGSTAAGVIGGELIVVGEADSRTFVYDLLGGSWSTAANDRPFAGAAHAAETVDGKLYLIGGIGAGSEGAVQIYDPVAQTWSSGAPMPWSGGAVSTAVIGGEIYAAGGLVVGSPVENFAVYDPALNQWTPLAPQPAGWGRAFAAAGSDGERMWIFGGRRDPNASAAPFADVFVFDPQTDQWSSSLEPGSDLDSMPVARAEMGPAVHRFGRFYLIGGRTNVSNALSPGGVFARVDAYDVEEQDWMLEASMPTGRHAAGAALFESRIFVPGGIESGDAASSGFEIFRRL
ncbi:MAG: kelch repeat-containing protein [Planctomycetota bacterium]